MGQIIAGVVGVALIVFILFRLFGRRGPKPNSRELAITVWAAFGPYESVKDAEESLRRGIRAVFGESNLNEHADWINGHVKNFRMWETSGTFRQSIEFMRRGLLLSAVGPEFEAACAKYKENAKSDALHSLDKITKEFGIPEKEARAMRASIDGSMPAQEIHEVIEAGQKERAARIVRSIGEDLLNSSLDEAANLRGFLQQLSREFKGEEATTPETLGWIYVQCFKYANDKADSEPRFAKNFHALNDAWEATIPKDEKELYDVMPYEDIFRDLTGNR